MASRRLGLASVRVRTTLAATLVVAVALVVGAALLVLAVRSSLADGLEASAEQRAAELAASLEAGGLASLPSGDPAEPGEGRDDDVDEPEELVWQVLGEDGTAVASSQPLARALPLDGEDGVHLAGADHRYVLASEDVDTGGRDLQVVVAVSLEEVADSTSALVAPLLVGLPVVLVLVAGTTWLVAARALAPVERIRGEVEQITADALERRVPEPGSRDEVDRLARTMNQMLARLQESRRRQQQFVADASHELRSPLASIRQTAEVSQAHPDALPPGELAEAVLEESHRMERLVSQLLLLTRVDEAGAARPPADVDLDDLALAEATRVARSGLSVDTTGIGAGRVRGDGTALAQVVRNLVDNAARHARSTVALSVDEVTGGEVELVVADDGPGIPAAERQRVFDRFVRLDDARSRDAGGSGLGLAIVRAIVEAHGGTVAVSASRLGGAEVVVRLPASADPGS